MNSKCMVAYILDVWPEFSICRLDYQINESQYIPDNDTIYDLSKELNALELLDEEDLIPSRVSIFLPEQKEKSAQIISDNPISGIWNRANGKLIIAERYPLGTQLQKLNDKNDAKNSSLSFGGLFFHWLGFWL